MVAVAFVLLVSQELAPLVWNAVDASEADYPKAILALRKCVDGADEGGRKRVAGVLAASGFYAVPDALPGNLDHIGVFAAYGPTGAIATPTSSPKRPRAF